MLTPAGHHRKGTVFRWDSRSKTGIVVASAICRRKKTGDSFLLHLGGISKAENLKSRMFMSTPTSSIPNGLGFCELHRVKPLLNAIRGLLATLALPVLFLALPTSAQTFKPTLGFAKEPTGVRIGSGMRNSGYGPTGARKPCPWPAIGMPGICI